MVEDDVIFLHRIINAIDQIERYTRGMSENEFLSRTMVQDAVVRQIEIIAEAATNVSREYQDKHAKLPWAKMIGIRERIIPAHFDVDLVCVWNTLQDELPFQKQAIKKLL